MSHEYIGQADDVLDDHAEPPMGLEEYVEHILEHPQQAAQSARYLLNAIESAGTREVIEDGEEKERYRFFDDPHNNGEHAVLGNTDILNEFVDDLRLMASKSGKDKKLVWFDGPTATGKSELKRCLVNGLRAYSRTKEGARYTLDWNIQTRSAHGLTYGKGSPEEDESQWYTSPVQVHPLTVFPPEVRNDILEELNAKTDDPIHVDSDLDPFSREAYDILEKHYERKGAENIFSQITDPDHLRVSRYTVDHGQGIGVLHSEDGGQPKQRLVGSWMRGMLQELESRGRKNPQAFSYDGVLAQGNSGVTIVEDASQHVDLLQKLLNVPEEGMVKIDRKIAMDIDTVMVLISNPDLADQLNQHEDKLNSDPLKALKRRLDKYEFRYLTNISSEVELLHRELAGKTEVWADDEAEERIREPITLDGTEFAPHTLETAGVYSVVTRLDNNDVPQKLNLVDKALIFERGYYEDGDDRIEKDEFKFNDESEATDGVGGIPVTYTRDILSDFIQDAETDVVMPQDVLEAMTEGLDSEPMFSGKEVEAFSDRAGEVGPYIHEQQEDDVIAAILRDRRVDEETVGEYIEHVYSWGTDQGTGEIEDPDPMKMKMFEIDHLGRTEDDYDGADPSDDVEEFRENKIIVPLNHEIWKRRDEDFEIDELAFKELPVIASVLGSYDWSDVQRVYENLDPDQWRDPPSNTETEEVKAKCIENMQEMFEYTEESARQTSERVMKEVDYKWD